MFPLFDSTYVVALPNAAFACGNKAPAIFILGLSLTALLPAAAWYFVVIVCHFLPRAGAKNDTQGVKSDRQAKVLYLYFVFPLCEGKNEIQEEKHRFCG